MKLSNLLNEEMDLGEFSVDQTGNIGDKRIEYEFLLDNRKAISLYISKYSIDGYYLNALHPKLQPTLKKTGVKGFYYISNIFIASKYQKQGLGSKVYEEVANQLWSEGYMLISTGVFVADMFTKEKPGSNLWASLTRKGKAKPIKPKSAIDEKFVFIVDDPKFRETYEIFTNNNILENTGYTWN